MQLLLTLLVLLLAASVYFWNAFHRLEQWQRVAVFSRLSRKYKCRKGPGLLVFVDPILSFIRGPVSVKDWLVPIKKVRGITRDNVEVECECLIVLRVADTDEALGRIYTEIEDPEKASEEAARPILSGMINQNDLDNLLHNRSQIIATLMQQLKEIVEQWGIEVRDFRMHEPDIMNEDVEAALGLAAAQMVRAKAQREVAKLLKEAAPDYSDPVVRWLKEKEVLLEAVNGPNNVIIVPQNIVSDGLGALARAGALNAAKSKEEKSGEK